MFVHTVHATCLVIAILVGWDGGRGRVALGLMNIHTIIMIMPVLLDILFSRHAKVVLFFKCQNYVLALEIQEAILGINQTSLMC